MTGIMRLGAAVAVAGVPVVGVALGRCAWGGIETMTLGSLAPDRAVATAVALAGLVAAAYLTATAVPLAIRRGSTRAPRLWRMLVAVALGLGATTLGATAATAVSPQWGGEPEPGSAATPASSAPPVGETMDYQSPNPLSPDPLSPQWGASIDAASQSLSPAPAGTHTVVRGDSLWRIAKALLPRGASDAEITRAWQAIYWLNRSTIGSDPGLIFPGQILTIPADVAS